jgi:hypothetical protein
MKKQETLTDRDGNNAARSTRQYREHSSDMHKTIKTKPFSAAC